MNSNLYYTDQGQKQHLHLTKKLADVLHSKKAQNLSNEEIIGQLKVDFQKKYSDANFNAALYELTPDVVVGLFKQNPLLDIFGVRKIQKHIKFLQFRSAVASGWANLYGDVEQAPLADIDMQVVTSGKIGLHVSYDYKLTERHVDDGIGGNTLNIKQRAAREILKTAINKVNLFGTTGYGITGSNVHGLLTSPLLSPVFPAINPGAGSEWSDKTGQQILDDILSAISRIKSRSNIASSTDANKNMSFVVMLPREQFDLVTVKTIYGNGGVNDVTISERVLALYPMAKFVEIDELKAVSFIGGNPDLMLVMLSDVAYFDDISEGNKKSTNFNMSYMFEEMDVDRLHNGGVECHRMVADTFGAQIYRPDLIERVSGI